jgi:hypothetical protein
MQRSTRRGLAVALMSIDLAACADAIAPIDSRAVGSSPALGTEVSVDGTLICTPCPPGLVCIAMCDHTAPIEVEVPTTVRDSAARATATTS